jgi:hypothetical protein
LQVGSDTPKPKSSRITHHLKVNKTGRFNSAPYASIDAVTSFNVWDKWPACKVVFEDIQDQSKCNAGWAVSLLMFGSDL